MRFTFRISVVAFLAAVSTPALAQQTVKIGAALSMTGPAAVYGATQKAGILAAVDEVNRSGALKGVKLEAVVEDDASTKEQGIAVFQRFINKDKVAAIIGPTLSNTATAADPLAQAAGVPVVPVSNTAPKGITDIGDFVWRVSLTEGQVIPGALKKLQGTLGFKKAGLLYGNDDAFTQAGYNVMKAALEAAGIPVVGTQTFAKPDKDYNAQLTAMKQLNPDILLVSAVAENAAGIATQAGQLGWNVPIMGGNGFNSPKFIGNAGAAAEGVMVGTAWNKASTDPVNQAFIAGQKARGNDPDQFCAQAYTGVLVIADAIAQSGMKGGREERGHRNLGHGDAPTQRGLPQGLLHGIKGLRGRCTGSVSDFGTAGARATARRRSAPSPGRWRGPRAGWPRTAPRVAPVHPPPHRRRFYNSAIVPSGSELPAALMTTVEPGVATWSTPAFATGGILIVIFTGSDAVPPRLSVTVSTNVNVPDTPGAIKLGVVVFGFARITVVPAVCAQA